MKKFTTFIFILLFFTAGQAFGQLAAGYSTDGNTLSLSLDPLNKIFGELRVNTRSYNQADWSHSDAGIVQLYCLVNVFSVTNVSLYTGVGLGSNLLTEGTERWISVNVPVGLRINPFDKFPNLFFIGEYTPMVVAEEGIPIIHTVSLGFRYRFIKGE